MWNVKLQEFEKIIQIQSFVWSHLPSALAPHEAVASDRRVLLSEVLGWPQCTVSQH